MAKKAKKAKKAKRGKKEEKREEQVPKQPDDKGLKLCPMLIGPCQGPDCRLWISPDESENGECVVLLAGLRLLAGDDTEFQEVTKRIVRIVALEGGKGLATMLKSMFGDALSSVLSAVKPSSASTSAPVGDSVQSGSSGLRGLNDEDT